MASLAEGIRRNNWFMIVQGQKCAWEHCGRLWVMLFDGQHLCQRHLNMEMALKPVPSERLKRNRDEFGFLIFEGR